MFVKPVEPVNHSSAQIKSSPAAWKTAVALITVYLIWGSTYLGIRIAIESIPPFLMIGTRFFGAGLLMWLWCIWRGISHLSPKEWRDASITGTMLLVGGAGGVALAEQILPSGITALFVATVPIYLTVFSWLWGGGARPSARIILALLLGLAGVAVLALQSSALPTTVREGRWFSGVAIILFAPAIWAAGSLYAKKAKPAASPLAGIAAQMLIGGTVALILSLLTGEFFRFHIAELTRSSVLATGYLIVFGSLLAFSAFIWLTHHCHPTLVGTYAFVNPMVSIFLGWSLGGEQVTWSIACGALLIVLAVVLIVVKISPKHGVR